MSVSRSSQTKFIQPLLESNDELKEYKYMSPEEKVEFLKLRFNLHHGKGKRKRNKKK